jgi:hypothetical protein
MRSLTTGKNTHKHWSRNVSILRHTLFKFKRSIYWKIPDWKFLARKITCLCWWYHDQLYFICKPGGYTTTRYEGNTHDPTWLYLRLSVEVKESGSMQQPETWTSTLTRSVQICASSLWSSPKFSWGRNVPQPSNTQSPIFNKGCELVCLYLLARSRHQGLIPVRMEKFLLAYFLIK